MNAKELITKDLSHVDVPRIKEYVANKVDTDNSSAVDKAVEEFLDNFNQWKDIVGFNIGLGEDSEWLYGSALGTFSACLYSSSYLKENLVRLLQHEIEDFEGKVKFKYKLKNLLYSNLVLCLHKLSLVTREELKSLLKKAIYYSLADSNRTSYQVECYAYRSDSEYLIESFREEKLSMSSPTTFNDPFDCPILELLNLYGDDISKLIREAYHECLKITCFVNNKKVEPKINEEGYAEWENKHENDPEEFLNELMWAHYAKNHTGVCVKYHFRNDITKFADEVKNQIAYFRDIRYTSDIYDYGEKDSINLIDAFFVKSEAWEYENELRLLSFDLNGSGNYANIEAKDSVAAVYFGLKCDPNKRDEIIAILKDKKWIKEIHKYNETTHKTERIEEVHAVEFFQMELDKEHFGKLKAVKI